MCGSSEVPSVLLGISCQALAGENLSQERKGMNRSGGSTILGLLWRQNFLRSKDFRISDFENYALRAFSVCFRMRLE